MITVEDLNLSPVASEANISEIQARAAALGLVLTARCKHCGAPLWSEKSLAAHAGPICRSRHKEAA
ncbi:hypothetical protein [Brevibacterium casei]